MSARELVRLRRRVASLERTQAVLVTWVLFMLSQAMGEAAAMGAAEAIDRMQRGARRARSRPDVKSVSHIDPPEIWRPFRTNSRKAVDGGATSSDRAAGGRRRTRPAKIDTRAKSRT